MKALAIIILTIALLGPLASNIYHSLLFSHVFNREQAKDENNPSEKKRFGILALPLTDGMKKHLSEKLTNKGFSHAEIHKIVPNLTQYGLTYLRYLKEVGLEVEPIHFNDTDEDILAQMDRLDGVLLTGGETLYTLYKDPEREDPIYYKLDKDAKDEYIHKIKLIIDRAKALNDGGKFFEVYSICLGMQGMTLVESEGNIPVAYVERNNIHDGVHISDKSVIHRHKFTPEEIEMLQNANIMFYYHDYGFTVKDFQADPRLNANYTIEAVYKVDNFGDCVGMIRHKQYPFTGVQFHPEKVLHEESSYFKIDHNPENKKVIHKLPAMLNTHCTETCRADFVWNNHYKDYQINKIRQADRLNEVLMKDVAIYKYLMVVGDDPKCLANLVNEKAN